MAIVEVRPIEKEKWHKVKGKEVFTRPTTVEALVSLRTGLFATGLSQEDRERLEKVTGFDLSPEYIPGKPHEFWNSPTAQVKLEYKTNIFDTTKPLDEIKVKILKASDLVANSKKDYEEGKYPNAIYVIYDEHEETELKATKLALRKKVLMETFKMAKERKLEMIMIFLREDAREKSDDYIDMRVNDIVEKQGSEIILQFLQKDKSRNSTHSLVIKAIEMGVLREDGASIYYMDNLVGYDIESAVDYFEDKKNQTLKLQILDKLK